MNDTNRATPQPQPRLTANQLRNLKKLERAERTATKTLEGRRDVASVLLTRAEYASLSGRGLVWSVPGHRYKGMVPTYLTEAGKVAVTRLFPVVVP